jgi:hypothetical protein
MREALQKAVKTIQTLAVQHSNDLWECLASANAETPAEAQLLLGAYMGALTEHVQQLAETTPTPTQEQSA